MARGSAGRTGRAGARRRALIAVAAALALAGCKKPGPGGEAAPSVGRLVVSASARTLAPSADGAWLAYLESCRGARGQYLPPNTASCDLRVVPSAGGEGRRIAGAVTTLPHAVAWHPRAPLLAALGEYDYLSGSGALFVATGGGAAERVADGVGFLGFVPGDERVVALAGGKLVAARPGAPPEWMPGADGLTSFELNPAWRDLPAGGVAALLRKPAKAGGALLAQGRDGKVKALAGAAGDYAFAPGGGAFAYTVQAKEGYDLLVAVGGGPAHLAGKAVRAFRFSPDGSTLAFVEGAAPGKQGDLRAGPAGGPYALMGKEVGEFTWARGAPRLAWLESYDARVRSGQAAAGGPGLPARRFGRTVTDIELSADGRALAYVEHTSRGGYSVDLHVVPVDGDAPAATVATGVFGFSFSPDSGWLLYRTRCVRNGEACDLERVPAAGPVPGRPAEVLAQGVKSFEFDPRTPDRLLLGWQRSDRIALDIGVLDGTRLTRVDTVVQPGTAVLLGPDSRRLAYVVVDPKRAGVYVADLPAVAAR